MDVTAHAIIRPSARVSADRSEKVMISKLTLGYRCMLEGHLFVVTLGKASGGARLRHKREQ